MSKEKRFFSAQNVAVLAVLLALVIVLQVFGGSIQIGGVSLNFTLLPVVLGALVLGPVAGAFLGFVCGLIVLLYGVFGLEAFTAYLWVNSPVMTALICLVKTTAAGFVSGWLFRLLSRKNQIVAVFVASGVAPVVNRGLFVVGTLIISGTIESYIASVGMTGTSVVYFIIILCAGVNFLIEFAINLLLAPAVATVYRVVSRSIGRGTPKGGGKDPAAGKKTPEGKAPAGKDTSV